MKIRAENEKVEHHYKTISYSNYTEFKIGMGFQRTDDKMNINSKVIYFVYK